MYEKGTIFFLDLTLKLEIAHQNKTHELFFISVHVEANASSFYESMQLEFGLNRCICEKRSIICVVYTCHSFYGISSAWFL